MFHWAYSGVKCVVPRNCGPDCAYYLPFDQRIYESIVFCLLALVIGIKSFKAVRLPDITYKRHDPGLKRFLLVFLTLIWGMEIGFKFASKTVIYILNPCHVTTALQIYLLAAPPSKAVTSIFRIHLNFLNGPLLAFVFPETESRQIPMEAALYWIQHAMMFVVPLYLFYLGGVYNMEPLNVYEWNVLSYCLNVLYHFIVLQFLAIPAQINLNHMLCPAIRDPFEGSWYRVAATTHQAILCPLLCKIFCLLAECCMSKKKELVKLVNGEKITRNMIVNDKESHKNL